MQEKLENYVNTQKLCTIQIASTLGSQKGKSGSTLELIDNEIENEFEIVPESANGSTGDKTVPELAIGKTEEKKVPAELVISKTEEKIVPEPASGNNADKTVPKPASNVDKTVPEPAKTVPEPAIAKNEDETVVPVLHTVGLWCHGI